MSSTTTGVIKLHPRTGDGRLAARLKREIEGDVLFDAYSRGRYSTDASIYQIEPVGVVIPKSERDAQIALQIALEVGRSITSQHTTLVNDRHTVT